LSLVPTPLSCCTDLEIAWRMRRTRRRKEEVETFNQES
jgi:hypothetical protein